MPGAPRGGGVSGSDGSAADVVQRRFAVEAAVGTVTVGRV
eukprot:CAMPEP_0119529286 /NCGR_PEP_ID=MMETSP1344-20130328/43324_1 /TAXON_ID=236787 /ORGANISM="Florenciella parvula, Strain CCMP2471" /LENGTH=39 /DNA_ID= /DNA_START= /DNA_END= /DNA_ORIENTATION=